MQFRIDTFNPLTQVQESFFYDNQTSELVRENGEPVVETKTPDRQLQPVQTVSKNNPGRKSRTGIKMLKISLGLSCNYECTYCSQRYVPHAEETSRVDIPEFLRQLFTVEEPEKIQFWGGEPLVYWKTLKPLAEAIRDHWPNVKFGMITNGSLLDAEKNEWIDRMGFSISISHDGPGYHVRGEDPLDDPVQSANIYDLYRRLQPQRRISLNPVLNKNNFSRAAIQEWLQERFGYDVSIGEGDFIDAYDEGGMSQMILDAHDHMVFRIKALEDLRSGRARNFNNIGMRINDFINSVFHRRHADELYQKCSMDSPYQLAMNLHGEVTTCQNVSSVATASNGESHKLGNVEQLEDVELKTATHWKHREECSSCPVLQLCKGSCMYLNGPEWRASCDAAFSNYVPFLAFAIEKLTGCVPFYIEGGHRADRKDIFGAINGIPEKEVVRKTIPIKLVA